MSIVLVGPQCQLDSPSPSVSILRQMVVSAASPRPSLLCRPPILCVVFLSCSFPPLLRISLAWVLRHFLYIYMSQYIFLMYTHGGSRKNKPNRLCHIYLRHDHIILKLTREL